MITWARAVRPPAPTPWTTRQAISWPVDWERPASTEPDHVDRQGQLDQELLAGQVGELAPDRGGRRGGQQRRGDHPGVRGLGAVQVGEDPRAARSRRPSRRGSPRTCRAAGRRGPPAPPGATSARPGCRRGRWWSGSSVETSSGDRRSWPGRARPRRLVASRQRYAHSVALSKRCAGAYWPDGALNRPSSRANSASVAGSASHSAPGGTGGVAAPRRVEPALALVGQAPAGGPSVGRVGLAPHQAQRLQAAQSAGSACPC